jgi:hypothetical protein
VPVPPDTPNTSAAQGPPEQPLPLPYARPSTAVANGPAGAVTTSPEFTATTAAADAAEEPDGVVALPVSVATMLSESEGAGSLTEAVEHVYVLELTAQLNEVSADALFAVTP